MSNLPSDDARGCIYELLPQGVHVFSFTGKQTGMDEFFEQLTNILTSAPPDTPVLRYIVSLATDDGQANVNELVRRFRRLEVALPQRPPGRTAILHNGNLLLTLMGTLVNTLAPQRDQTRFFKREQYDDALAWVLANE